MLSNTVSNINTSIVVIAPITHTQRDYPVFVPIKEKKDATKKDATGNIILTGCADISAICAISSYRLAGLVCDLSSEGLKQIDAAIACHLDLMHNYNTVLKVAEDKKTR